MVESLARFRATRAERKPGAPPPPPGRTGTWWGYLVAAAVTAACTLVSLFGATALRAEAFVLVFAVGILGSALRAGIGPAIVTAVGGVLVFDFVFVPPALAFSVPGVKDGATLAVMVVVTAVAVVLAEQQRGQVDRLRRQAEVEQLRNGLLRALSHDLRAPLTVLVSASETLCNDELGGDRRRELSRMVAEESRRLSRVVGNLLELTRLESGATRLSQSAHAIDEIIGAALGRLAPQLQGRLVKTRLEEPLPLAFFDPVLIELVMNNLLENAVRYAPCGSIEVHAHADDRAIWVEVADRGPGVPPTDEAKVFERFYRGPQATRGDGGLGLGLTICHAIVQAHGGEIRFSNRPGGGAVVRFALPISPRARSLESDASDGTLSEAVRP